MWLCQLSWRFWGVFNFLGCPDMSYKKERFSARRCLPQRERERERERDRERLSEALGSSRRLSEALADSRRLSEALRFNQSEKQSTIVCVSCSGYEMHIDCLLFGSFWNWKHKVTQSDPRESYNRNKKWMVVRFLESLLHSVLSNFDIGWFWTCLTLWCRQCIGLLERELNVGIRRATEYERTTVCLSVLQNGRSPDRSPKKRPSFRLADAERKKQINIDVEDDSTCDYRSKQLRMISRTNRVKVQEGFCLNIYVRQPRLGSCV